LALAKELLTEPWRRWGQLRVGQVQEKQSKDKLHALLLSSPVVICAMRVLLHIPTIPHDIMRKVNQGAWTFLTCRGHTWRGSQYLGIGPVGRANGRRQVAPQGLVRLLKDLQDVPRAVAFRVDYVGEGHNPYITTVDRASYLRGRSGRRQGRKGRTSSPRALTSDITHIQIQNISHTHISISFPRTSPPIKEPLPSPSNIQPTSIYTHAQKPRYGHTYRSRCRRRRRGPPCPS
jgi:hypothetical protein